MHTVLYIFKKHTKQICTTYAVASAYVLIQLSNDESSRSEMSTSDVLRFALQALYTLWIFSFDMRLKNYLTRSCKNTPCFLTPDEQCQALYRSINNLQGVIVENHKKGRVGMRQRPYISST